MKKYIGLLKYLKAYKRNIILYFVFVVLSIVFSVVSIAMLFPFLQIIFSDTAMTTVKPALSFNAGAVLNTLQYYLGQLIITHDRLYALGVVCIFMISAILLKNLFLYLSIYMMSPIRNGIMVQFRNDLFNKILTLPIGYFTEQQKGDLMSRMTNDTWELEATVSSILDGLIKDPLNIILYLGTLVFLSPQLSLILLVLLPVAGFIIGRVSKALKKQSTLAAQKSSQGLSILEETLSGMRVIKAFNAESAIRKKFIDLNDELYHVKNKMNFRRELASPLSEVLGIIVLSVILWFGGSLILKNQGFGLNGSGFIMYIAIFSQIISPAKSLSNTFYNIQKGSASLHRIETVLNTPNTLIDKTDGHQLTALNDGIVFKDVSFAYKDIPILKNINLTIGKGKTIALVGSSGAGKSTLADLVPRFHDVTGG
ncbi:MAG: transporter ATP-binding protein, partial [Sediminibacterium sp.]|nr:transporter ATP-binding protein [Sediminibacterium sp.]